MPSPKKPAAKATKSTKSKAAKPAESLSNITIDPSQSASSVAAALAARAKFGSSTGNATSGESASFKQLKEGLAKPQFSAGSPLAGQPQQGKFTGPSGFAKQTGHNQTVGHNPARSGVPRRTNGS